jgi:hypothetical protein
MNSLYFDDNAETVSVDFVNLNSLVGPDQVIDLLKCDIEGAEQRFIENYNGLLERTRTAVFELHHEKCDTIKCMKILRALGLSEQRVVRETPTFSVCHFSRSKDSARWEAPLRESSASKSHPAGRV